MLSVSVSGLVKQKHATMVAFLYSAYRTGDDSQAGRAAQPNIFQLANEVLLLVCCIRDWFHSLLLSTQINEPHL